MMMRRSFDLELAELNKQLYAMGNKVKVALNTALEALESRDTEQLMAVVAGDKAVNDMEKELEGRCLHLLMKQQPVVAADLRAVSAALKLVTDLERMGDQAQDIADIGLVFCKEDRNPLLVPCCLKEMAGATQWMVEQSLIALESEDLELARMVGERDDTVDDFFHRLKGELAQAMKEGTATGDNVLDVMMIGKYLERIADHSVNVCEWVDFYRTGRHQEAQIL